MHKSIIFLITFLLLWDCAYSQHKWKQKKSSKKFQEISFGIGATNFLGELGGANKIGSGKINIRDFDFNSIRPDLNIGYRYQFHKNWGVKAEINAAYIGGNDQLTKETYRNNRNLSFRSPIIEISGRMEYCISFPQKGHKYELKGVKPGEENNPISFYFFGGIAGFWFDPRGKLDGVWYRLRPLNTEGQGFISSRKTYSNFQFAIPFGLGIRYAINKTWSIGLEYGVRWTFTDYLDDVSLTYVDIDALMQENGQTAVSLANPSPTANTIGDPLYNSTRPGQQRGDPRDKDSYMFGLLSLYYKLDQGFVPMQNNRGSFNHNNRRYLPKHKNH